MLDINIERKIEIVLEKLDEADFNFLYMVSEVVEKRPQREVKIVIPSRYLNFYNRISQLKGGDPSYSFINFIEDAHREWVRRYIKKLQKGELYSV